MPVVFLVVLVVVVVKGKQCGYVVVVVLEGKL